MSIDPAQRPYEPRGAAKELIDGSHCRYPEILIEGPAGTGKTRAIAEKANLVCEKYPGCRILFCRKTRKSLNESVLVTYEEKVLTPDSKTKEGPTRAHRDKYTYPNGSEIILGGLDYPERLFSTEFDIICLFEATEATLHDYESLHRALRNGVLPYQQIIADCNPSFPSHWLWQRAHTDLMHHLPSRFEDNPSMTPEYLERLSKLTGVRRDRLYLGRWVAAEGAVWPEYDARVHLLDRFPIPDDWQRFRSIDFGYTNPFVCQWWAQDGDGRLYMYREIYMTGRTVRQHAEKINELSAGERIAATICDHDAEDRATLRESGIATSGARKDVASGIQAVAERLRSTGDGKARLYLLRDSLVEVDGRLTELRQPTCTAQEIEGYLWKMAEDGSNPKEEPDKQRCPDHGCDAMRYMVKHVDTHATAYVAALPTLGEDEKRQLARADRAEQLGLDKVDDWCTVDNDAIWEPLDGDRNKETRY